MKTVSNIVPKCNRNVQTVNLKAALIHAMNTVSSEPALLITTGNSSQYQALHRGATKIYRGQVLLIPKLQQSSLFTHLQLPKHTDSGTAEDFRQWITEAIAKEFSHQGIHFLSQKES